MRVQRHFSINIPIPPSLPPNVVVAALQTFSPVIRHLGTLARFEELPANRASLADDPFFVHGVLDADAVSSFQVYEVITLAPGLTKEVTYPVHFQSVHGGLRCRADGAAGIVGWAEFTVRAKRDGSSPSAAGSTPGTVSASEPDEYELHEALLVEANSLLMPFVVSTMEYAHRGLCNKVLDEVMQRYNDGYDYSRQSSSTT